MVSYLFLFEVFCFSFFYCFFGGNAFLFIRELHVRVRARVVLENTHAD